MSLYKKYVEERTNKQVLESDHGFAVYSFTEDAVYIEDIFVETDYRNTDLATNMAYEIGRIAREKGFKKMLGSVVPSANNSTISLKVLLANGFKLDSCAVNFILFSKEI